MPGGPGFASQLRPGEISHAPQHGFIHWHRGEQHRACGRIVPESPDDGVQVSPILADETRVGAAGPPKRSQSLPAQQYEHQIGQFLDVLQVGAASGMG